MEVKRLTDIALRYTNAAKEPLIRVWRDEKDPKVVVFAWNNHTSLNAFSVAMGDCFTELIGELQQTPATQARALVITGTGRAFSAGGDFEFLQQRAKTPPFQNVQDMLAFYRRFLCVRQLPIPTIAAINGHAVGAGCCFTLACDLRIASADAKLGFNFAKLGIHPGMAGTLYLPQLAGFHTAATLFLTGRLVSAQKAQELGMVGEVVPDGPQALSTALELAREISANSESAVGLTLATLRRQQDVLLEQCLEREAYAQATCYVTDSFGAGLQKVSGGKGSPK